MRSRSFTVMVIGAVVMVVSWTVAAIRAHFYPIDPVWGRAWDAYRTPTVKVLGWCFFAGALVFVSGLAFVSANGAKRLWTKNHE